MNRKSFVKVQRDDFQYVSYDTQPTCFSHIELYYRQNEKSTWNIIIFINLMTFDMSSLLKHMLIYGSYFVFVSHIAFIIIKESLKVRSNQGFFFFFCRVDLINYGHKGYRFQSGGPWEKESKLRKEMWHHCKKYHTRTWRELHFQVMVDTYHAFLFKFWWKLEARRLFQSTEGNYNASHTIMLCRTLCKFFTQHL